LGALEPGQARVRLINATTDVDDLDLYIAGTKTRLQHGIDTSMVTSVTDVDPGTLEIRPQNKPAPPQLSNLKVEADRFYTFMSPERLALWMWFESRIGSTGKVLNLVASPAVILARLRLATTEFQKPD
jgi:hypothetical protein